MKPLADQQARTAATTIVDQNIVVSAGAGTGKTSLLVERVLNLVGSGFCELERLAAITFTEKAAAELRLRIAEGLEQLRAAASGEGEPDPAEPSGRSFAWLTGPIECRPEDVASRALAALQQIDRARVQTIHAFCAELLRSFPVEGRVDPDFTVDTGEQFELLCRSWWERFVEREFGPRGARHDLWMSVLETFNLKSLAEAGRMLAGWSFPAETLDPDAARGGLELLREPARTSLEELVALEERATGITNGQQFWISKVRECLAAIAADDEAALDALLADPAVVRELEHDKWKPGKRLSGVSGELFTRVMDRARQLVRYLPYLDDERCAGMLEAIAPFATSFREEYTRRGFVSFDGLLALARDLLRDHPEVRESLKGRFDTLLVDEFQDTDPLQYEIVLMLGEAPGKRAADPWEVEPAPGRLFVVGDPKQSIYRFRGADYDAFHRAVEKIGGDDALMLTLSTNFRSVPGILDPVNALFDEGSTTCWRADATQPIYQPIAAPDSGADEGAAVDIWTVDRGREEAIDRRRRTEGRLIADEIERLHADGVPYGKVSILFRTFASIPTYLRPLRERNIPFVVDGGKDFIKRPEIKQSLAVLRTLAQPSDATALLAFLRSPAGGVPDTELATWAAAGRRWDWRRETGAGDELCPRIASCLALLRDLDENTRDLPPDAAVRAIVERVQLLPLAAAAFEGAQRVANLHKLVAAASNLTRDGHLSLEDLIEKIEEGGLAELEADSPLSDDDTDAVRITSIHKMKGLENDWVLLPDLARQRIGPRGWGLRLDTQRDRNDALHLAVHHGKNVVNAAAILHHVEHLQHEEAEETRVLYVALTRARKRLILISSPGKSNATRWYGALKAWGYDPDELPGDEQPLAAGAVRHRLLPPPDIDTRTHLDPPQRELGAVNVYDEAVGRLREAARPPFRAPSSAGHDEEPVFAGGAGRDLGLAVGRVIHTALEYWDGNNVDALREAAASLVKGEAHDGGIDEAKLSTEVDELLGGFTGGELGNRFGASEIVARELPLLLRDGEGGGWRGSIDLVYREDDAYVVADYKTDRSDDEAALAERYAGQLGVYARALRDALGLATLPRAELWLLRHGRRVTVAVESPESPQPAKRTAAPKRTKPGQQNLF